MNILERPVIRLSQILQHALLNQAGEQQGRVDDLVVHLGEGTYPLVTGLHIAIGRRRVFAPIDRVAELSPGRVQLRGETVNLHPFERREGEVLLRRDILHHPVILVETGRLIPVPDIALSTSDGTWQVVGIDVHAGTLLQRLLRQPPKRSALVDWSRIEPFVGHVPTAKLRLPLRRLRGLHPAQLADLVEAASPEEGSEIISAMHGDPELEADVFEELDTEHQLEFLHSRSDTESAAVLGTMSPDDAADLIAAPPQERRTSILARLPSAQQDTLRGLLSYNPSTAGGIMTPRFLAVEPHERVGRTLEQVAAAPYTVSMVYLKDADDRLVGTVALQALLRAGHDVSLADSRPALPVGVRVDADFTEVALLMADYNLVEAPVVDAAGRLVGVVSVDDVLETLIPMAWRRRAEVGR